MLTKRLEAGEQVCCVTRAGLRRVCRGSCQRSPQTAACPRSLPAHTTIRSGESRTNFFALVKCPAWRFSIREHGGEFHNRLVLSESSSIAPLNSFFVPSARTFPQSASSFCDGFTPGESRREGSSTLEAGCRSARALPHLRGQAQAVNWPSVGDESCLEDVRLADEIRDEPWVCGAW